MFANCCLSCLLILASTVCNLSVIFVCEPLLFMPSCCLRKSVCWISCCPILPHLLSHLVLVAVCYKKNSPCFVASFLPLGLFACGLFLAARDLVTSYSMYTTVIVKHGICSLIVWPGRWVSCPVFSDSKQIYSSPRDRLKIGCQSSVKETASKKLVQRVLVLLWWIVQNGVVSPLLIRSSTMSLTTLILCQIVLKYMI